MKTNCTKCGTYLGDYCLAPCPKCGHVSNDNPFKKVTPKDFLVIFATGMVAYGLWLVTPAAMFIGVGLMIILGLAHGRK